MRRMNSRRSFPKTALIALATLFFSGYLLITVEHFIASVLARNFTLLEFSQSMAAASHAVTDTSTTRSAPETTQRSIWSGIGPERQIATFQELPRRNNSRSLCGAILTSSPKASRFPRIFQPSSTATRKRCASNAILYLVQKGKHSSYNRNSTALFLKSLDKLYENYLSINHHSENVDVLIFHSGDYTRSDLDVLDRRFNHNVHFKLIDLTGTDYWEIPESVRNDNINQWGVVSEFSVGYRHMIRFFALKLYDFIRDYANDQDGCSYNYLMRLDEDSFVHSPIQYNLFDFMQSHNYSYGYRMCSYEMEADVWDDYEDHMEHCGLTLPIGVPLRRVHTDLCCFYNNFFILDVRFIHQPEVQHFLQWVDAVGVMYRERYGDMLIQTIAVYHYLPPERIHRFLDWTYEHMTFQQVEELDCPGWGAIQEGYLDVNANAVLSRFRKERNVRRRRCPIIRRKLELPQSDLSPTYSHLPPPSWWNETKAIPLEEFLWRTIAAGAVESSRSRGNFSG